MNVERGDGGLVNIGGQAEIGENQEQGEEGHVQNDDQEEPEVGEEQGDEDDIGSESFEKCPTREDIHDWDTSDSEVDKQTSEEEEDWEVEEDEEIALREADIRFKDDLDIRRSRQEVDSLQNLALKCIGANTDYFRTQLENINSLPGPIFQLIGKFLHEKFKPYSPEILPIVISEKIEKLSVFFYHVKPHHWTSENVANVLCLIGEKCKGNLKTLKLDTHTLDDGGNRFLAIQISVLLPNVKNLTKLSIGKGFEMTDDTLLVLGMHCHQLSSLNISGMKQITDTGVDYLCAKAAPFGQCKNLETLNLNDTSVTEDGLVTALSNLPKLTVFKHDKLFPALYKFAIVNLGVEIQLQLQELSCHGADMFSVPRMEIVYDIIPHVTSVYGYHLRSIGDFLHLNAISRFYLLRSITSLPELNSFITHSSSSLTNVCIAECNSDVDLSVFGCCPNLDDLHVRDCHISSTSQFQLVPSSFRKLKSLFLSQRFSSSTELDVSYLMQMISSASPTLCFLGLRHITFPEASLYSLMFEAMGNNTVFSNLKKFHMWDTEYSLNTWMQFICICPKLSALICKMPQMSKLQLVRFVQRNNLHIKIDYVP